MQQPPDVYLLAPGENNDINSSNKDVAQLKENNDINISNKDVAQARQFVVKLSNKLARMQQ